MARSAFILLILAVVVVAFCEANKCGPHAVWKSCGSACAPTCRQPKPQRCAQVCVKGCQCKPGYLKASNGACVVPKKCHVKKH